MTASAIYRGRLSHRRLQPKRHEFAYPVYMLYLDLDELPSLFPGSRLWSSTGRAAVRFRRADYFGGGDRPLDVAVRDELQAQLGERPAGPIRLLANVRGLGYVFNPICLYFCFDAAGERLTHVLADVTNTPWRDSHAYAFKAGDDGATVSGEVVKAMHVSPFLDMDFTYAIRCTMPAEDLHVSVANRRAGETHFVADLRLQREPATNAHLRRAFLRWPSMAASATAHIYLQALRMRLKGFRTYPHVKGGMNHA